MKIHTHVQKVFTHRFNFGAELAQPDEHETTYEPPKEAEQVNTQVLLVGETLYQVTTYVQLSDQEQAQRRAQQAMQDGGLLQLTRERAGMLR